MRTEPSSQGSPGRYWSTSADGRWRCQTNSRNSLPTEAGTSRSVGPTFDRWLPKSLVLRPRGRAWRQQRAGRAECRWSFIGRRVLNGSLVVVCRIWISDRLAALWAELELLVDIMAVRACRGHVSLLSVLMGAMGAGSQSAVGHTVPRFRQEHRGVPPASKNPRSPRYTVSSSSDRERTKSWVGTPCDALEHGFGSRTS